MGLAVRAVVTLGEDRTPIVLAIATPFSPSSKLAMSW